VLNSVGQNFNCEQKKLSDGCYLHLINIEEIDEKLEQYIDERVVSICEGNVDTSLSIIKKRLKDYFITKSNNLVMGSIAEFFCHLYITGFGFKQEFLYLNLEEGSIKKGFDGYYSLSNEEWVFESKSGLKSTSGNTHESKIKESYVDLVDKFSGGGSNNPWKNAYNHASHIDVNCDQNIRKNIKQLSENYTQNKFCKIEDFNVMPGSTIFLQESWEELKMLEMEGEIAKLVDEFQFNKINIICINKKSTDLFINYLEN